MAVFSSSRTPGRENCERNAIARPRFSYSTRLAAIVHHVAGSFINSFLFELASDSLLTMPAYFVLQRLSSAAKSDTTLSHSLGSTGGPDLLLPSTRSMS